MTALVAVKVTLDTSDASEEVWTGRRVSVVGRCDFEARAIERKETHTLR